MSIGLCFNDILDPFFGAVGLQILLDSGPFPRSIDLFQLDDVWVWNLASVKTIVMTIGIFDAILRYLFQWAEECEACPEKIRSHEPVSSVFSGPSAFPSPSAPIGK